jgi:hypothetical protein
VLMLKHEARKFAKGITLEAEVGDAQQHITFRVYQIYSLILGLCVGKLLLAKGFIDKAATLFSVNRLNRDETASVAYFSASSCICRKITDY